MDLSVKISELSGVQSHMLRINGSSRPLILHSFFLCPWQIGFWGWEGRLAHCLLAVFGAIHYVQGWGKVSMWPSQPVFSPQLPKEPNSLTPRAYCSPLRVNVSRGYLAAPLEKPDHIRHRITLRAEIGLSSSLWLLLVSISHCVVFMVLKPLHGEPAMQATRASTTSVFADCSIPAGLRIGPVQGIFKLGKYFTDRKEVVTKKKVSTVFIMAWNRIYS